MLKAIEFNIGDMKIQMTDLNIHTIIICENTDLVKQIEKILLDLKNDKLQVGLYFENIDNNEDFIKLLEKLKINQDKDCITIEFLDLNIFQRFYITTTPEIVYESNSYLDVWFVKNDEFYGLYDFKDVDKWYRYKGFQKELCRDIRVGRYRI